MRPLYLGNFIYAVLFGCLTSAISTYITRCRNDGLVLKMTVWTCYIFTAASIAGYFQSTWYYTLEQAGDYNELATYLPSLKVANATSLVPIICAQTFYALRTFGISRNKTVLAVSVSLILLSTAMGIGHLIVRVMTKSLPDLSKLEIFVPAYMWSTSITDLWLCASFSYFLQRERKGFNLYTDTVLKGLMVIAIESALPTALASTAGAIAYQALPTTTWFTIGFINSTPLYSLALLFSLNSRKYVRTSAESQAHTFGSGERKGGADGPPTAPAQAYQRPMMQRGISWASKASRQSSHRGPAIISVTLVTEQAVDFEPLPRRVSLADSLLGYVNAERRPSLTFAMPSASDYNQWPTKAPG